MVVTAVTAVFGNCVWGLASFASIMLTTLVFSGAISEAVLGAVSQKQDPSLSNSLSTGMGGESCHSNLHTVLLQYNVTLAQKQCRPPFLLQLQQMIELQDCHTQTEV